MPERLDLLDYLLYLTLELGFLDFLQHRGIPLLAGFHISLFDLILGGRYLHIEDFKEMRDLNPQVFFDNGIRLARSGYYLFGLGLNAGF